MGAEVETYFLEARVNPLGLLKGAVRFQRLIRTVRPNVVHAHYGTVTGLFSIFRSRLPVVITFRGSDLNPSSEFSSLRGIVSRVLSHLAALWAAEIICVSKELRGRLWWCRRKVEVVPSGVDLEEFRPMNRDAARLRLGWSPDERLILFNHGLGRTPNKRLDLVEAAGALLRGRIPTIRLVVLEGSVPIDRVPEYLNASDAVVVASEHEGSPNIVKEALACNVPVCSVRVGDVAEM